MKKLFTRLAFFIATTFLCISSFGQDYVYFDYSVSSYCDPAQANFYNSSYLPSLVGSADYKWYVNGIQVSNSDYPENIPLTTGNNDISLEIYDNYDNRYIGKYNVTITIASKITDFQIYPGTTVCPGEKLSFYQGSANSIRWNFGYSDYFSSGESDYTYADFEYPKTGNYIVTMIAQTYCGSDTVKKTISVTNGSIPSLLATDVEVQAGCPNDPVKFYCDKTYSAYLWEFGDGETSSEVTPLHIYKSDKPITYNAKLTVTNACGGSANVNFPVTLVEGNPANSLFSYMSIDGYNSCPGSPYKFDAEGDGSYYWQFSDGSTSNEKSPVHSFGKEGEYPVTLTVTNGCSLSSITTNTIYINNGGGYVPEPYFYLDANEMGSSSDTFLICPGTNVKFNYQFYPESGNSTLIWDFGDGNTFIGQSPTHTYSNPGFYQAKLTSINACGTSNFSVKYIKVGNDLLPMASLSAFPSVICPGDKIFFRDSSFDPAKKYTYSITFGDGNSRSGIESLAETNIDALESHTYNLGGPYNYIFKATNNCGNSITKTGTITVSNSSTRVPDYFINNSTLNPYYTSSQDFSTRKNSTDFEIDVPVIWPDWNSEYGTDFYLLLWNYGIEGEANGNPAGFVKFTSASINTGTTVKAFIPTDNSMITSVGISAAFYCGGIARFGDQPEASGSLVDTEYYSVNSITIIPSGYSDLSLLGYSIQINPWDGICNSARLENTWYRQVETGVYAVLTAYDTGDGMGYTFSYQDALDYADKTNMIDEGYYYQEGDNLTLNSYYNCYQPADYQIIRADDNTLEFIAPSEDCSYRTDFLSGVFHKKENTFNQYAACPNDNVLFKIAGGKSYLWDFTDGKNSTAQFPVHSFASPGVYNVKVTATNNCGRQDVLYTKVTIADKKNRESEYIYYEQGPKMAGDTIQFYYYDMEHSLDNNTYLWNFGDGKTSNTKNPKYVYSKTGNYSVSLTVTNGCGSNTLSENIYIGNKLLTCEAKFDYGQEGTVYFQDNSTGNPDVWSWDFGDGNYSSLQNPEYSYLKDGVYNVTLTIYNSLTKCFSTITKKVFVGSSACNAEFEVFLNSNSGYAKFTPINQSATGYYWNFGDGGYSTEMNPVYTYTKTGIYKASLTAYDSNSGCTSVYTKNITMVSSGETYILADFSYFADNLTVSFNDLSTLNATNWYWTMGDGKIIKNQNPVYSYTKAGIYKVCLIAYDNVNSISNTVCKEVKVGEVSCNLNSAFSYFVYPVDHVVKFSNNSRGVADKYFWTFGDGSTSTSENPVKQYDKAGFYKVSLSVRNTQDNCLDESVQLIQVGGSDCKAGFEYRVDLSGNILHFKDKSNGSIDYYFWDFGDGSSSILENPFHLYKKGGLYNVSQTVLNTADDCMDVQIQQIQLGEISCSADFVSYIDSTTSTAYFTNRILGESTAVLWSFGDGKYSTTQNPVHQFPGKGIYSTGLNTYDLNTGCMDYFMQNLTIGSIGIDCSADFIYSANPSTNEVKFSDKSTGDIVNYLWNFGDDSELSTEKNPVHTYLRKGYYYVSLSISNSQNVKNLSGKWILIEGINSTDVKANFMYTVDSNTRKVQFTDNSYGTINKYTWNFGDSSPDSLSFLQNPSHTYTHAGYYLVKLEVKNTLTGNESSEYKLLNIGANQVLKASFGYEAYDPGKKLRGYPVDLVGASSGDGATVEWDFGDKQVKKAFIAMDSSSMRVRHIYENSGAYLVCLRISDPVSGQVDQYCGYVQTKYGLKTDEIPVNKFNLNTYPNPFVDYVNIDYFLPNEEFIEVSVYNQLGQKIEQLANSRQEAGEHHMVWNSGLMSPGVYHLKFKTSDEVITTQLVISK